jgi:two-component system, sensor histidine kinase and response regulator
MEDGFLGLEYQDLSPTDLVERALAEIETLAGAKGLSLIRNFPADPVTFFGDAEKLRRTLVNLLGNAIRFTPQGGAITVSIEPEAGERMLTFRVSDTGPGIPAEAFDRIFEKFGQVEAAANGQKLSTGLGLTFCKMAVETHGGQIWVESELDRGSTFSFSIPMRPISSPGERDILQASAVTGDGETTGRPMG